MLPELSNFLYEKKRKISVADWRKAYNKDSSYPYRPGEYVPTNATLKINDMHLTNDHKKDYLRKKNYALKKCLLREAIEKKLASNMEQFVKLINQRNDKNKKPVDSRTK